MKLRNAEGDKRNMAEWKKPVRIHVDGKIGEIVPIWDGKLAVQMVRADEDPVWYVADFDKGEFRQSGYLDVIPFSKETNCGWVQSAEDQLYHLMNGSRDTGMRAHNAGEFCEGLAWFLDYEGLYGYCKSDGQIIFDAQFTFADDFYKGYAYVEGADEKVAFLDKSGRLYQTNIDLCSKIINRTYIADLGWRDGKQFYAVKSLKTGKTLSEFACSDGLDIYEWDGGALIPVLDHELWGKEGKFNRSGKRFYLYRGVSPAPDNALKDAYPYEFLKGEWVRPMGRQGYICKIGGRAKYVFEGMTEASDFGKALKDAWPFYDGMARVMDAQGCYHYIDRQGSFLEGGWTLLNAYDFTEAFTPVKLASGWAIMDRKFNSQSGQLYENMEKMAGIACVLRDRAGHRYLMDLRGEENRMQPAQPIKPAQAVKPAQAAKSAPAAKPAQAAKLSKAKQKIWSLSSFAEGLLTLCAYDDSGDKDREELQKKYTGDAWLQCVSVQQAEDLLYAYMEKKEKLVSVNAWEDEGRSCVHYILRKTPADGTQVLVKLVFGEAGVFLRMYHQETVEMMAAVTKASAFHPLPRMEKTVFGTEGQNVPSALRRKWSVKGEHTARLYAYPEYSGMEEALNACEASMKTGFGLAEEEPVFRETESGKMEGYILFVDKGRPWCNTIQFDGVGCAAALVFDTDKNTLEVYLSGRYRDWYSQNGT